MKNNNSRYFAAISLALILVSLIYIPSNNSSFNKPSSPPNTLLEFKTTQALLAHYQSINYHWPITSLEVNSSALIRSIPKKFSHIKDPTVRKTLFIRIMLPLILAEQRRIQNQRRSLALILSTENNSRKYEPQLNALFDEYHIEKKLNSEQKSKRLLSHYDELPLTLVLAQAAIESGWGASRFVREGNSLFGEWTYSGYGIIPLGREEGKSHRIKSFPSLQNSIASYIKNINRNPAYKELRQYRKRMRSNNQPLDSRKLAEGLHRYSQKGKKYVVLLLNILDSNEFKHIETLLSNSHS